MSTPIKSSNVSSTNSLTTATYSPSSYSTNSTTLTNYEEKAVSIFNGLVSKCCDGLGLISSIEEITTERIGKIYECIYFGELLEDYVGWVGKSSSDLFFLLAFFLFFGHFLVMMLMLMLSCSFKIFLIQIIQSVT